MTEVDPNSGEVLGDLDNEALALYEPVSPVEVEQLIVTISERLEKSVPIIKQLWENRYAAERKFIEERAKAMMRSTERTVARQRAEADLASLQYKHEFDNAKAILHAAEELQKALTARLYGLLNINKGLIATYQAESFGRNR